MQSLRRKEEEVVVVGTLLLFSGIPTNYYYNSTPNLSEILHEISQLGNPSYFFFFFFVTSLASSSVVSSVGVVVE